MITSSVMQRCVWPRPPAGRHKRVQQTSWSGGTLRTTSYNGLHSCIEQGKAAQKAAQKRPTGRIGPDGLLMDGLLLRLHRDLISVVLDEVPNESRFVA